MSPYCRDCLGIARPGELRCPLDHRFYLRRSCANCQQEVYPRELFCVHCGRGLEQAEEVLLLPQEGGRVSIFGALFLDLLGVGLTVWFLAWSAPLWLVLLLALGGAVAYRTWGRAMGRQSFGQSVFQLMTVAQDATPATYSRAFRRTLGEFVGFVLLMLPGDKGARWLANFSDSFEVRLA